MIKYNVLKKSCVIGNDAIDYNEFSIDVVVSNRAHKIIFKGYDKTSKDLLDNNQGEIILKNKVNTKTAEVSTRAYAVLDFGKTKQEIELKMSASDIFILQLYLDGLNK